MRKRTVAILTLALLLFVAGACTPKVLTAAQAKDHVGETATVCGKGVSARYSDKSRGQPTFLNLDRPYPNHIFTIVIWGSDRSKFNTPEDAYRDKQICVTGKFESYQGVPQIIARDPGQIQVK